MKWIKTKERFEADIYTSEQFNVSLDDILEKIESNPYNIWEELNIKPSDIEDLKDIKEIDDWIEKNGWTLSEVADSRDWETFLAEPVKWSWALPIEGGIPEYLFLQLWDDENEIWNSECVCYKVEQGYEWETAITSIIVKITKEDDIISKYRTDNGGNNWIEINDGNEKDWEQLLHWINQNNYSIKI